MVSRTVHASPVPSLRLTSIFVGYDFAISIGLPLNWQTHIKHQNEGGERPLLAPSPCQKRPFRKCETFNWNRVDFFCNDRGG